MQNVRETRLLTLTSLARWISNVVARIKVFLGRSQQCRKSIEGMQFT